MPLGKGNAMKRARSFTRAAWALVLAAFLAMGLAACAQEAQTGEPAEPAQSGAAGQQQSGELYGSPWVTSVIAGNLPAQAPEATADLYLHYSYDYIAAHQDTGGLASVATDVSGELKAAVTGTIKDAAIESDELAQLRILYNQAADLEALEAGGADALRPYLKAIADTKSLEDLNQLLISPDFPFSPWIDVHASAPDMKSAMCAQIIPHMLFADEMASAEIYRDTDDETAAEAYAMMRLKKTVEAQVALPLVSQAEDSTQAVEIANKYFELEKKYGKECVPADDGLDAGYGLYAQQMKLYSADELAAACPNFPLAETIAKAGMGTEGGVIVTYPAWLAAFNGVWTEENFELLRGMTEVKILCECAPFIAPSYFAEARSRLGMPALTADDNAYAACDKTSTFSQLLAKTYVEQTLGEQAVDDLTKLTNNLIDAYIDLVGKTPWLNDQSRENIIDKIDNMALNILYPDGGYFDYGGLKLTPSDQGGTLLGNYLAVKEYNKRQEAALLGQPARAGAIWIQQAPTLQNCFYDPISNSISICPGYVTSVMYSKDMGQEELLGGIGFTIAHEISHAFDYNGSQLNAYGQPIAVFSNEDVQEFVERCKKLASRYSAIDVKPGTKVNGAHTVMEAAADLSGLQAVLVHAKSAGGIDNEKLFGQFASKWAAVYPSSYASALLIDPHPLSNLRVNVSAQMCGEFYDTFNAKEADMMYLAPEERATIWGE